MKLQHIPAVAVLAIAPSLLVQGLPLLCGSSQAFACGGFFCSSINLVPIEQNAERILFEINTEGKVAGTVTATVEISYTGRPEDFSWVLPVSDLVGQLGVAPPQALLLLDDATAPRIVPPPTKCTTPFPTPFAAGADVALMAGAREGGAGVLVEDLEQVGPYEPQLVSSEDAGALIAWLGDNDYLITPEMEPAVAGYVAAGMKFLAMKLAPDAGVADIAPIQVTYPGDEPMVPLVLTSVGAEPEMGVLVLVAGDSRFESANYSNFEIDTAMVQANPSSGVSNYYPLVSWQIDESGGQAMITEFMDSTSTVNTTVQNNWSWNTDFADSLAFVTELSERQAFITRMYTRVSAWEMNSDPAFQEQGGALLSNVHDLSDRPAVETCMGAPDPTPCGSMYCGVDAQCATTSEGDACLCPAGTVARVVSDPRVQASFASTTVFCQDTTFDLMASVADMALSGAGVDPCANFSCGDRGQCMALNGFPTCLCEDDFAAVPDGGTGMTCAAVVSTYAPEQLLWNTATGCSCSSAGSVASLPSCLVIGLALLPAAVRRRRG
jgi:hypothetical protein